MYKLSGIIKSTRLLGIYDPLRPFMELTFTHSESRLQGSF